MYRRKSFTPKRSSRRKVIFKFWHNLNDRNKGLLAIAFLSLIMLVVLILVLYAVRLYPISGGLSIGCLTTILYHVFTESTVSTPTDSFLHDHHEAENRFWSILAFVFTCAVIFGETPVSFGYSNPILGLLVAVLTTVYVVVLELFDTHSKCEAREKYHLLHHSFTFQPFIFRLQESNKCNNSYFAFKHNTNTFSNTELVPMQIHVRHSERHDESSSS